MAEKYTVHVFKPEKTNQFRCAECPYLANNPIHRRDHGQFVRGTAHPTKFG